MNKEKLKDLRFIIVFIAIVSFSFIYLFQTSYAKYRKQIEGETSLTIAKWNIKVNNEYVDNKAVLEEEITPTFTGNERTKDSVVAPGITGYCDIVIDATDVDVDFDVELTPAAKETSSIPDLKPVGYIINPVATSTVQTPYNGTPIKETISRNSTNNVIRIYLKWDDDEASQTMTNEDDTKVALDPNSKALIGITIKFTQKK